MSNKIIYIILIKTLQIASLINSSVCDTYVFSVISRNICNRGTYMVGGSLNNSKVMLNTAIAWFMCMSSM